MRIELDLKKTAYENAGDYFEKAKKLRKKIEGAEKALKETGKEKAPVKKEKPEKRRWYENFRYFHTSAGFLVVAGKDAKTNEELMKRHAEKNDVVFHAEIIGAPFAVIKAEGKEVDGDSLAETAVFAASYSRAWKAGIGSVDVYWVRPEQASKKAPSGEYLGRGAFMISGRKNYFKNTKLEIGIGAKGGKLIYGPLDIVKKETGNYVVLVPGGTPVKELAGEIRKRLGISVSMDDIQRIVPFGTGSIR